MPIYDVVDSDMARLAIEKLQIDAMKRGISPQDALKFTLNRDAFAVKFYDPYVDEFKHELGLDDEEDEFR